MFLVSIMLLILSGFVVGSVMCAEVKSGDENSQAVKQVDKVLPNSDIDKGSPMHAWKAIVSEHKKAGDIITKANLLEIRNWSNSTVDLEIASLKAIGVLGETGMPGEYKVLVDATVDQIDEINKQAKTVVDRKGVKGEALGINRYKLTDLDEEKIASIKTIITGVLSTASAGTTQVASASADTYNCKIAYDESQQGEGKVNVQRIYGASINKENANKLLVQLQNWNDQDVPVVALFANDDEAKTISSIFRDATGLELGDLVYKDIAIDAETGQPLSAVQEEAFANAFKALGNKDLFFAVDYNKYQKILKDVGIKV